MLYRQTLRLEDHDAGRTLRDLVQLVEVTQREDEIEAVPTDGLLERREHAARIIIA